MKQFLVVTLLLAVCFSFTMCKKGDNGPVGPAGPQGPQGPIGIAGNANVTQYTYGSYNFAATPNISLFVATTADTMNRSAWFVYMVGSAYTYPIPGPGAANVSQYRLYWAFEGKVDFYINKITGAGETYPAIKIIRIYANNNVTGGRVEDGLPAINFNDYKAVCNYYHLTE